MNKVEGFLWKARCNYYRKKVALYVIMGNRKKANETFNKVLDMLDAYRDMYL